MHFWLLLLGITFDSRTSERLQQKFAQRAIEIKAKKQDTIHPLASEVDRALIAPTLVKSSLSTSSDVIVPHVPSSSSEPGPLQLPSPIPASNATEEEASDAFMADLAAISGIPASSPLLSSRSPKRSLSRPLISSFEKK